jgi:hypothetical protein
MHFKKPPELSTMQKNEAVKYVTRTCIMSMSRKIPDLGIFSNLTSDMATLQKNQTVNTKHEQTSCPCPEKYRILGYFLT